MPTVHAPIFEALKVLLPKRGRARTQGGRRPRRNESGAPRAIATNVAVVDVIEIESEDTDPPAVEDIFDGP